MAQVGSFGFEGTATWSEAADVLLRLAEGLRAGSLALSAGRDEITVSPAREVSIDVEATDRDSKGNLEIVIGWRHADDEDDDADDE